MNEIWRNLHGQERIVEFLSASQQRPKDAYLFTGPAGAGKTQAARIFAAGILCDDSCGACNICRRVLSGLHPDVQIFQPEGYTYSLDLIREVVSAAGLTPLEGARRVFIIEEADRIAERSQNGLLKALEEPGGSVTWILVADTLHPLLPTVLSRCVVVEFTPVPEETAVRLISERYELSDAQAQEIVRASRGDLEQAMSLASGGDTARIRSLAIEVATSNLEHPESVFEITQRLAEVVTGLKESLSERQAQELSDFDESSAPGRGLAGARKRITDRHKREIRRAETDLYIEFLRWLAAVFRDMAAIGSGGAMDSVTNRDEVAKIGAVAGTDSKSWLEMVEQCLQACESISQNAVPSLQIESILLRLVRTPVATI